MKIPLILPLACAAMIAPACCQVPAAFKTGVLLKASELLPSSPVDCHCASVPPPLPVGKLSL